MAQSNVAFKQTDPLNAGKLLPTDHYGRVRCSAGFYVGTAADAAGTVIQLARLPKGARLLPISKIYFAAGQASGLTVKVGDEIDDARYFASATVGTAAGNKTLEADALNAYVNEKEMFVNATTAGAALAAGVKISFLLFWVLD